MSQGDLLRGHQTVTRVPGGGCCSSKASFAGVLEGDHRRSVVGITVDTP